MCMVSEFVNKDKHSLLVCAENARNRLLAWPVVMEFHFLVFTVSCLRKKAPVSITEIYNSDECKRVRRRKLIQGKLTPPTEE